MLLSRVSALALCACLLSGAARAELQLAELQIVEPRPAAATTVATPPASPAAAVAPPPSAATINAPSAATSTPPPAATSNAPPAAASAATATPGTAAPVTAAPAAAAAPPKIIAPTLTAQIDLAQQSMVVAENGVVKYSWPISSGTAEFPTPRGTFRAQWTAKMWYSRKYDNAPMPHAVFINGGVAVHATQHVRSLGQPASHGCIRLAPGNARMFYNLVQSHGLKATRVSVYGTPKWRAPQIASRSRRAAQQYAARQDSGSWFGNTYQPISANDRGFVQRRYRQPPRGYYYADAPPQRIYYRPNGGGQRYVNNQRPQRRTYYDNNSGYGNSWFDW